MLVDGLRGAARGVGVGLALLGTLAPRAAWADEPSASPPPRAAPDSSPEWLFGLERFFGVTTSTRAHSGRVDPQRWLLSDPAPLRTRAARAFRFAVDRRLESGVTLGGAVLGGYGSEPDRHPSYSVITMSDSTLGIGARVGVFECGQLAEELCLWPRVTVAYAHTWVTGKLTWFSKGPPGSGGSSPYEDNLDLYNLAAELPIHALLGRGWSLHVTPVIDVTLGHHDESSRDDELPLVTFSTWVGITYAR